MKNNFERQESEICEFCKASPFVDCAVDCPCNFSDFGQHLPESLRGIITVELLKQAEWIYEKKQLDWMNRMLIERVESVMKDWPVFMTFLRVLHEVNYFESIIEVIDFVQRPKRAEQMYLVWNEMGEPTQPGTKMFEDFRNALENLNAVYKEEDNGRASSEEE